MKMIIRNYIINKEIKKYQKESMEFHPLVYKRPILADLYLFSYINAIRRLRKLKLKRIDTPQP